MFKIFVFLLLSATLPYNYPVYASQVEVKKNDRGEWNLLVDGKPYFIRGMSYMVDKVGESPLQGHQWIDWAWSDENHNGKIDGPYDAWVDRNMNNHQDPDEPSVGDFELMKEMGVNTIRWYTNAYPDQKANKELLRDLYKTYGIRVVVGDYFGAYCLGSGTALDKGTDYRDPVQQEKMLESVRHMVIENKDEPYLLIWLLGDGNDSNFSNTNAEKYPEAYASFLNKAAVLIHTLDGKHPVALSTQEDDLLKFYAKLTPDVDILGINSYPLSSNLKKMWGEIKTTYDKPVLITAYGGIGNGQAAEHKKCWRDIQKNMTQRTGVGNSIGGIAMEWLDRWWLTDYHIGDPQYKLVTDGFFAQGDGSQSPFLRQMRPVYLLYRDKLWKDKDPFKIDNKTSEVILRSGQELEGAIAQRTDKYIKIDTGIGMVLTYYADEIDTVDGKKFKSPAALNKK